MQSKEVRAIVREEIRAGQVLGLGYATSLWLYVDNNAAGLWYYLNGEERVYLPQDCLTGYIRSVKVSEVPRNGANVQKLAIFVNGDRPYAITSGLETQFSRGFLSLAALDSLESAVTIRLKAGEKNTVFCNLSSGGKSVFRDNPSEKLSSEKLLDLVETINGKLNRDSSNDPHRSYHRLKTLNDAFFSLSRKELMSYVTQLSPSPNQLTVEQCNQVIYQVTRKYIEGRSNEKQLIERLDAKVWPFLDASRDLELIGNLLKEN